MLRVLLGSLGLSIAATSALASGWSYRVNQDEMGRGSVYQATATSTNTVTFPFPYGGPQTAGLQLRVHPKYGRDAILFFKSAQFLCDMDGCNVSIRFDDDKPERCGAVKPADHSTDTLFLQCYSRLVSRLKTAKTLRIEAAFYRAGNHVVRFDVAGLEWEPAALKRASKATSNSQTSSR